MFARAAGIELRHVPYKGSAPAISDLLGGQIPLMFDPVQSVLQHIRGGKLRALAVSSAERSAVLPQVPTLNESGLKGFEATAWWALFAPAGLPPAVAAKLDGRDAAHRRDRRAFAIACSRSACRRRAVPRRRLRRIPARRDREVGPRVRDAGMTLE